MLLRELVAASVEVGATRSRTKKTATLSAALRTALETGPPREVESVALYLAGELRQRRTGLGWRSLTELPPPADDPTLTVAEVDEALQAISEVGGAGSQQARTDLVDDLFGRATADEQDYLRRLVTGGVRQGALDGVMLEAVAQASEVPSGTVRRAAMLAGSTVSVVVAALTGGEDALEAFRLETGRPVRPMLASSAPDVAAALAKTAPDGRTVALDRKIDGIRMQVHRSGADVLVVTRSLDDITDRVPEVVEAVAGLDVDEIVLDGEAVALGEDGRPLPFQETAARTSSRADVAALRARVPLTSSFFDVLRVDGEDLLDRPARERFEALTRLLPEASVVPRLVTDDPAEAESFFAETVAAGHEGVVVKSLDAPYEAGRRGAGWVKVKPRHTLDLVVLAVEWGSGRRKGWLSNIHLGARDPDGGFVMLGKTFKGLADSLLRWQTERFQELKTREDGWTVYVRPEQVVEIAFDGVQRSSRYPGGVALRFARVLRYRDDKTADEADTIETVRAMR